MVLFGRRQRSSPQQQKPQHQQQQPQHQQQQQPQQHQKSPPTSSPSGPVKSAQGHSTILIRSPQPSGPNKVVAIFWTSVEVDIDNNGTDTENQMNDDTTNSDGQPPPPPAYSAKPPPSLDGGPGFDLHSNNRPGHLVLDGRNGSKFNNQALASLLSSCSANNNHLISVTLLCGEQYELSLHESYDQTVPYSTFELTCRNQICNLIRSKPRRVLGGGTEFYTPPRDDLVELIRLWKLSHSDPSPGSGDDHDEKDNETGEDDGASKQSPPGFKLYTEFQIAVMAGKTKLIGIWNGQFSLDTRLVTIISPSGCGRGFDDSKQEATSRLVFSLDMLKI